MTIFGVDISSYQGSGFNFTQAKAQGVSFAVVKATEGDNYANPYCATQVQNSLNAGLLTMSYHFVHSADENGQVAEVEANVRKDLPLWLDSEVDGSGEYGVSVDLVRRLRADGWNVVGTYLPRWFWSQIGSPDLTPLGLLWASGYPGGSGSPAQIYQGDGNSNWNPYGNVSPTLWQFTNQASVAGQSVDCSAFRGSLTDLENLTAMALTQADANLVASTLLNWMITTPNFPAGTSGRAVWDVLGDGERVSAQLNSIGSVLTATQSNVNATKSEFESYASGSEAQLQQIVKNTTPPLQATATVDPSVLQSAVQAAVTAAVPVIAAAVQAQLDAERTAELLKLGYTKTS